jgi:hypothetical protein
MKWKKRGKWVRMEDRDYNNPRFKLMVLEKRLSNFARSLPFDWKEALVCWPIAIGLIVILFLPPPLHHP